MKTDKNRDELKKIIERSRQRSGFNAGFNKFRKPISKKIPSFRRPQHMS